MKTVLVIMAVLSGLAGLGSLSNATMGVGGIAAGCLLAILARMVQAGDQHAETLETLAHLGATRANTREAVLVLRKAHNVTEEEVEPVKAPSTPGPKPRAPRPYTPGNFFGPHPK